MSYCLRQYSINEILNLGCLGTRLNDYIFRILLIGVSK
jgi:hypothetical protein